ncbi:ABC transporter substrate-binding protein [Litoribacillus peritrichatus]|uniref:ABC transporter substrate-binding protein n=1 Tax=Litoribacillus peritrichatus TaxID=718191 RepID=A0ABP7MX48_9GAMM
MSSPDEVHIVTEDFPPYNYEIDGFKTGLSTEIIQALLKELNAQAKIKTLPWPRAYRYALNKKNHLIYSIARIPEREKLFHWVGEIAPYKTSFYKLRTRTDLQITRLEDAKKFVVGTSLEDVITTFLEKEGFTRLEKVAFDKQNIRLLLYGRVDLIAYDEVSFVYKVRQEGLSYSDFERAYRIDALSDVLYVAFSLNTDEALVNQYRQGLASIRQKGVIEQIQKKYLMGKGN